MITEEKEIQKRPRRVKQAPAVKQGAAIIRAAIHEGLPHPRGATWDGKGTNSPCFPRTRPKSRFASSMARARKNCGASRCPNIRNKIWHGYLPDIAPGTPTAIACMALMSPMRATVSIRTSCCSILTPARMWARLRWDPALFGYKWSPATTSLSTNATALRSCRNARSWIRASTGRARATAKRAVGRHDHLRNARAGIHQSASGGAASICAELMQGWQPRRCSSTSSRWA